MPMTAQVKSSRVFTRSKGYLSAIAPKVCFHKQSPVFDHITESVERCAPLQAAYRHDCLNAAIDHPGEGVERGGQHIEQRQRCEHDRRRQRTPQVNVQAECQQRLWRCNGPSASQMVNQDLWKRLSTLSGAWAQEAPLALLCSP